MNTRLKTICILFGVAYYYLVGASIWNAIPNFLAGFKDGWEQAHEKYKQDPSDQVIPEIFLFHVKPHDGEYTYPTSLLNLKTGNLIQTESFIFHAKAANVKLSTGLTLGYAVCLILAFPMLLIILFIPIQIYKVIRSIVKNEIFELRNIKRMRWIGYALLIVFAISLYSEFILFARANSCIRLEDYKIVFSMQEDYYYLLFGLVTLLFAEILNISHTMKEEQDLTI